MTSLFISAEYCLAGVKSGEIPDSSMTSSTDYRSSHAANKARLDASIGVGAWCSKTCGWQWSVTNHYNDKTRISMNAQVSVGEWIQVDFGSPQLIAATTIQGRSLAPQWVTSYKVACGEVESNLSFIREGQSDKVH